MANPLKKLLYIILSILSGYVEFGIVLYMLAQSYSAVWVVITALAFQIGNLVPVPIKLNKLITRFSIAACIISFAIVQYLSLNMSFWIMLIGITLLSVSIQSIRSNYTEKTGTTSKRVSRVAGFMFAPFFSIGILILVMLVMMTFTFKIDIKKDKASVIIPKLNYFNVVMIVHQMHYFSYTYFLIIILYKLMDFSAVTICLAFSLSWITYISIGYILNKPSYRKCFIAGHTFLFIVLVCVYLNHSSYLQLALWICTGFGAGTFFALNKLDKESNKYEKNAMDYSENIGHVLGTLISIPLYLATESLFFPVAVAAIFALIAATLIFLQPYLIKLYNKRLKADN
jgi:hypothetical protein